MNVEPILKFGKFLNEFEQPTARLINSANSQILLKQPRKIAMCNDDILDPKNSPTPFPFIPVSQPFFNTVHESSLIWVKNWT